MVGNDDNSRSDANWKRRLLHVLRNCCVSTSLEASQAIDNIASPAKLIHSTAAFSLDRPVAEHNLQLNDLCKKNTQLVFRYEHGW